MKKTLTVAIALTLTAAALSSCGGQSPIPPARAFDATLEATIKVGTRSSAACSKVSVGLRAQHQLNGSENTIVFSEDGGESASTLKILEGDIVTADVRCLDSSGHVTYRGEALLWDYTMGAVSTMEGRSFLFGGNDLQGTAAKEGYTERLPLKAIVGYTADQIGAWRR